MGHRSKKKGKNAVIDVGEELTIGVAAGFRERILKELQLSDTVTLNLENIESIDIAGLQLLCSANRSFERHKKAFTLQAGEKLVFLKSFIVAAGYDENEGCPEGDCKRCLWRGGTKDDGKKNTDSR